MLNRKFKNESMEGLVVAEKLYLRTKKVSLHFLRGCMLKGNY